MSSISSCTSSCAARNRNSRRSGRPSRRSLDLEEIGVPEEVSDLEERVILVVNGVNRYFESADLNKYVGGEHLEITLVNNILQKMSPRGRFRPATICFADSKRIVEGGSEPVSYRDRYARYRETMLDWIRPGRAGRKTLDDLGLTDDFGTTSRPSAIPRTAARGS